MTPELNAPFPDLVNSSHHFREADESTTYVPLMKHGTGKVGSRKPDDSRLDEAVRLAQQGEHSAFEYIYRIHWKRVYGLRLRMVRDANEAEDLTQEVFLQLFRKIHTFRGESAFSSWLHRLAANLVLMHFRKNKPTTTSLDQITATDGETNVHGYEFGVPDLRLSGLFDRISLQAAVDQLPKGHKAMFILYDVHGLNHREIAEILGCSVGNSKSQLHRARKRLRKLLGSSRVYGIHKNCQMAGLAPALVGNY